MERGRARAQRNRRRHQTRPHALLTVIVNPSAGRHPRLAQLDAALELATEHGWRVERLATRAPGHAQELAARAAAAGSDCMLVCGGDGTINEAVNGLAGSETAL